MLASLLGCSFEAYVINDESVGSILRAVRGIEVTDETLGFDVIEDVVHGAGHFLGTPQTFSVMETEYLYPVVGDRVTPIEWAESGSKDMWQRARERVTGLMQHYPDYLSSMQEREIRGWFDIKIGQGEMMAGNGRW